MTLLNIADEDEMGILQRESSYVSLLTYPSTENEMNALDECYKRRGLCDTEMFYICAV